MCVCCINTHTLIFLISISTPFEYGERFQQDILVMKTRYQGHFLTNMLGDYCWFLQKETSTSHKHFWKLLTNTWVEYIESKCLKRNFFFLHWNSYFLNWCTMMGIWTWSNKIFTEFELFKFAFQCDNIPYDKACRVTLYT